MKKLKFLLLSKAIAPALIAVALATVTTASWWILSYQPKTPKSILE